MLLTIALLFVSCTSCNQEDERYVPFPGGKCCEEQPDA